MTHITYAIFNAVSLTEILFCTYIINLMACQVSRDDMHVLDTTTAHAHKTRQIKGFLFSMETTKLEAVGVPEHTQTATIFCANTSY